MTKASKQRAEKKVQAKESDWKKVEPKARNEDLSLPPPAANVAKAQSAPQAPQSTDEMQAIQEYIQQLLDGKAKLANRYARDMLQQVRSAEQQLAQLAPRIERLQQTLEQAQTRRTALAAISQQLGVMLYRWRDDGAAPVKDGD